MNIILAFLLLQDGWTDLIGDKGLEAWKPGTAWSIAGDVKLDEADPKKLLSIAGTGVITNGNTKGKNLFTTAEFGDVELHVEFTVSKGSNSGVYLMGRYEIQVLDSWGVKEPHYSDC